MMELENTALSFPPGQIFCVSVTESLGSMPFVRAIAPDPETADPGGCLAYIPGH